MSTDGPDRPDTPVLWHIPISHYSEKARWALDYKRVEHERRAPPPGLHIPIAMALTRSTHPTFPVLQLDGRGIGDSSAIIAALEHHYPEHPLYPDDPAERRRALDLEDHFDEVLGPQIRLLVWHDLITDDGAAGMASVASAVLPPRLRDVDLLRRGLTAYGDLYVRARFGVASDERAATARDAVRASFDRLERELDGRDHLVGDRFSVADLTAASLFYPLVQPPEGPQVLSELPSAFEEFAAPLRVRPAYAWVERTFREYRKPGQAAATSPRSPALP